MMGRWSCGTYGHDHQTKAEAVACEVEQLVGPMWGHEHASQEEAAECVGSVQDVACIPGDADAPTPVYASDAQVQAVMEILIAEGALPRGVASFGKPLEDFARRLVEAAVGSR